MKKNTEKLKELDTCATYKSYRKRKRALRRAGCSSLDPEKVRQLAFAADHLDEVTKYAQIMEQVNHGFSREKWLRKFDRKLTAAGMPTRSKELDSLRRTVQAQRKIEAKRITSKRRAARRERRVVTEKEHHTHPHRIYELGPDEAFEAAILDPNLDIDDAVEAVILGIVNHRKPDETREQNEARAFTAGKIVRLLLSHEDVWAS